MRIDLAVVVGPKPGLTRANHGTTTARSRAGWRAGLIAVAVPTAIAGIYGMNFEYMPELKWRYGYPLSLAFMTAICVGLYVYFKRKDFL